MRINYPTLLAALAVFLVSPPFSLAVVLHDNGPIDGTNVALRESDIGKTYRVADGIALPTPGTIRCVTFAGGYLANPSVVGGQGDFTLNIHANTENNMVPIPGDIIASSPLAGSRTVSAIQIPGTKVTYDYVMNLDTPLALGAGTYWVSILDHTVAGEASWLWAASNGLTGWVAVSNNGGATWLDYSLVEVSYALHDTLDCPTEASLLLTKTDNDTTWSPENPVVPYEIEATASGGALENVILTETVPEKTTFESGSSTPGWICSANGSAARTCKLDLGNLADGESETVTFAARVEIDTPTSWDLYNDVVGTAVIPAEPIPLRPKAAAVESETSGVSSFARDSTVSIFCSEHYLECLKSCIVLFLRSIVTWSSNEQVTIQATSPSPRLHAASVLATTLDFAEFPLTLYRLRDRVLARSRGGQRATQLYYELSPAMVAAITADDSIGALALSLLESWKPLLEALAAGEGATTTITPEQIEELGAFLDGLRAGADGDLATAIDRERARLHVNDLLGAPADEVFERLARLSCEGHEESLYCGEVSGDCVITAADALRVLRMAVGQIPELAEADLDGNGNVSASDALKTLRIAVGTDLPTLSCNVP